MKIFDKVKPRFVGAKNFWQKRNKVIQKVFVLKFETKKKIFYIYTYNLCL